jgi:hypothetical protein
MHLRYLGRLIMSYFFTESPGKRQYGILTYQGIMLVGLDSDQALGARHLQCGVGSVDDRHKLQEEMPLEYIVVPDVKVGHIKRQHLLALVVPYSTEHLQVNASDGCG